MVDKVFRNNKVTKKIEFVGNFEGLYREVDDHGISQRLRIVLTNNIILFLEGGY